MDHRSANSLTFTQAATIAGLGSITFQNTGNNGFQSGAGRCILQAQHKPREANVGSCHADPPLHARAMLARTVLLARTQPALL